ncbi:putative cell surface spherulin 4-like protein [Phaeomoniella chlamydospora]|uniref:Putative cell surface spherulin 4-like protein n=1 Tax=Phaeomoniella chlamydospora TaxID=158046 RepID=A0A0G2ERI8_PHACM|nr:putative cell surface spherulin 4-like protein [Phaeomoniella chlamydospora]
MAITFILFPLYIYPIANAWSKVFEQIKAKPNLIFDIVININNGPGSAANHPNSDWVNGISQLHSYNNTRLLGYVHVSRAERNYTAVAGDIEVWASWANYAAQNISMDGIFFDEAPSVGTTSELTYMKNATTFARNEMAISESSSPIIVFNPGTTVPDDFYDIADYIVALEETYAEYSKVDLSSVSSSVASKSIFIVYDFTGSVSKQSDTIYDIANAGMGGIFISTKKNYFSISSYWSQFCTSMNNVVSGDDAEVTSASTSIKALSGSSVFQIVGYILLVLYLGLY